MTRSYLGYVSSQTTDTVYAEVYGSATGGSDLGTRTIGGVDYKILEFTATDTLTVTKAGLFDVLLIAGGGGGADEGSSRSAGGGAGGYIEGTIYLAANATVVVGAGGSGRNRGNYSAIQSGASLKPSIVAIGGGARLFIDGGSGGGRAVDTGAGGASLLGQGNAGGANTSQTAGGGGGGAGGAGGAAPNGAGGAGKDISTYVGGSSSTRAVGGSGAQTLANGTTNFGNGGVFNGAGGSGVVFIRVRL